MASFSKLDPRFRPWAEYIYNVALYYRLNPRLTSGFRSMEAQKRLYSRYLRGANPYPVAPPGRSFHNYGLAIDLVTDDNVGLGRYWESLGGRWGGSKDPVHFQV